MLRDLSKKPEQLPVNTVCPRSLDPIYVVSCILRWPSWTETNTIKGLQNSYMQSVFSIYRREKFLKKGISNFFLLANYIHIYIYMFKGGGAQKIFSVLYFACLWCYFFICLYIPSYNPCYFIIDGNSEHVCTCKKTVSLNTCAMWSYHDLFSDINFIIKRFCVCLQIIRQIDIIILHKTPKKPFSHKAIFFFFKTIIFEMNIMNNIQNVQEVLSNLHIKLTM